jgi:uncharacterized protein (TIGR04255 family)
MPFPEAQRVVYSQNPLVGVTCQLRFPPILRIDSEVPAAYQERIRASFPLFSEESVSLPLDLPAEISQLLKANIPTQASRKAWKFASADNKWSLVLTRDSIALSAQEYRRWEEFEAKLRETYEPFFESYHPSFLTRIGLRYSNIIDREKLKLGQVPWKDLLQPHIAAEYSSEEIADSIEDAQHQVVVLLPNGQGKLGLRHGTARRVESTETLYVVDNDFFIDQRTEVRDVFNRLTSFNRLAGHLFRWIITDRLHDAMEPTPVS